MTQISQGSKFCNVMDRICSAPEHHDFILDLAKKAQCRLIEQHGFVSHSLSEQPQQKNDHYLLAMEN